MSEKFDWDEDKNQSNRHKHGIKRRRFIMKKEYDFSKMKEIKNPYPSMRKKAVGINLSPAVIDYFKNISIESGIPYQKLIDLYLLDCVRTKKKPSIKWSAS